MFMTGPAQDVLRLLPSHSESRQCKWLCCGSLLTHLHMLWLAGNWLSRRCLDVFTGARAVAQAEVLRKLLPDCPGLHLWLVKPPRSR